MEPLYKMELFALIAAGVVVIGFLVVATKDWLGRKRSASPAAEEPLQTVALDPPAPSSLLAPGPVGGSDEAEVIRLKVEQAIDRPGADISFVPDELALDVVSGHLYVYYDNLPGSSVLIEEPGVTYVRVASGKRFNRSAVTGREYRATHRWHQPA